jgi:hypothetical protein
MAIMSELVRSSWTGRDPKVRVAPDYATNIDGRNVDNMTVKD